MYKVRPVCEKINFENLPTTMYRVKSYYQVGTNNNSNQQTESVKFNNFLSPNKIYLQN